MNISAILQQFNLYDHQVIEFMGHPVIQMPTSNPKFPNVYGKVRLSVMLRSLPVVLAFVASNGTSWDPQSVTDEDLEAVISHLRQHCRPQTINPES